MSHGVSTDTRTLAMNNLFFAIHGSKFNANEFAEQALSKGASYAVIDDEGYMTNDRMILVENALRALQELATFHRSKFKRPLLGITGSNGKTTTKELVDKVLSQKYTTHTTIGNYNNHIGVPLTLLHLHPQVEIAIIEMGANHTGEIAQLCEMASPTHGLITNIGRAHTETFGGIEKVIKGKSELFDYLQLSGGVPFVNIHDAAIFNMKKRFKTPTFFPPSDMLLLETNPFIRFKLADRQVSTQLIGKYNFHNIAAAVVVGRVFGIEDEQIAKAIASYLPANARSQVIERHPHTIILDAYNANPDSMIAALENLAEFDQHKVAILGDMNEIERSEEAHQEVLDKACEMPIDQVFTVGKKIGTARGADRHFDTKECLIQFLDQNPLKPSVVLLKASRSIELETILNYISE